MFTPYFYFVALAFAAIQASAIVIPQGGNIALLPRQIIVPTDAPTHVDRRQIIFPTDAPVQVGRRAPEDCKDGQFCGY